MANSNVTQGISSLNDIYKNKLQSDPATIDSQFYGDIANLAGPNPKGWRAIWGGFFKGLESGAKSKAAEKFSRNMDWIESMQKSSLDRNLQLEEQAFQIEQAKPFAAAALEASYSGGDYGQTNQAMGNIFQQLQMKMPSLNNYRYAGYVPNTGIINLVDDKGKPLAINVSTYAGKDVSDRVTDNYIKNQQLGISREHNDIARMNANTSRMNADAYAQSLKPSENMMSESPPLEFNGTKYETLPLNTLEKKARADYQNEVVTKGRELIPKNNQALEAIHGMEEVFKRNPNIGSSFVQMLDHPDGKDSFLSIIGRKLGGKDLEDLQILKKHTNDLNLDTILGITGKAATDLLKRAVQAASPSGKLEYGAFVKNANTWKKKAQGNINLYNARWEGIKNGMVVKENAFDPSSQDSQSQNQPQNMSIYSTVGGKMRI